MRPPNGRLPRALLIRQMPGPEDRPLERSSFDEVLVRFELVLEVHWDRCAASFRGFDVLFGLHIARQQRRYGRVKKQRT